jgi:NADP-dependent 3-hydroxy acid dehydrogenase YdfG
MDVGDLASIESAFGRIDDEFGALDALVNNAAVAWPSRLEHASDDELVAQVQVNLLGPLRTMRAAIPLLRRAHGHIVNISSESAREPFPMLGIYAATKAALEVVTESLVHELATDGIRLTLLRSGRTSGGGFTATWGERRDEVMALWEEQGFLQRVAGTEAQAPERIAETVRFVLEQPSDSMIDFVQVRARPAR